MHLLKPPSSRAVRVLRVFALGGLVTGLFGCGTSVPLYPAEGRQVAPPAATAAPRPLSPPPAALPVVPPPRATAPLPLPQASFALPAQGPALSGFDGDRNKGLDIAGQRGDPVFAARDGRVVIVSNALPSYGRMIILKHDDTFITAYAHLDQALVSEGDMVQQGQKIAEMGNSGTDRVKLHFEIRKQGVAVDPRPYLDGALR